MTKTKAVFYGIAWLMSAAVGCTLIILAGVHLYLSPSLPSVESLRDIRLQTPLRIYSSDGKLIGEIGEMRRTPINYEDIPQGYIDALLSAEDAQFYSHRGVSLKGLMRASSQLLMSGDIQGGGSTITMQVARNFFLSTRQEFKRKFNEILLALRIERELSKEKILELYVNVIFMGNRAYGIHAASQVYYGKQLHELSTAQLAMLAAIPKGPSVMNPLANAERAKQRRDWILGRMHTLGKLDHEAYLAALNEPLSAQYHGTRLELNAAYVSEMARQRALELFGANAYTDGYRVYTTVHSELQQSAQEAVIHGLLEYERRHGYRGPEQQLPVPESLMPHLIANPVSTDNPEEGDPSFAFSTPDPTEWQAWQQDLRNALRGLPTYGGLRPAAVTRIDHRSVDALLADGTEVTIKWANGLSAARPFLTVNSMGPRPSKAADVLSPGDVIRVRPDAEGQWQLRQIPHAQAAMVSMAPRNGAILALAGGFDFRQSNFNRVVQARRQPGSSFKPFVFAAALERGFTAASVINDAPIVFEDQQLEAAWRPENSSGNFHGPTRLRPALAMSRNLVAIRLLRSVGLGPTLEALQRYGFNTDTMPRDLSLALGSNNMTPLELTTGYAVLANGGYRVEPYFIERILDFDGQAVYESRPLTVCLQCERDDQNTSATPREPRNNDPFLFTGDGFEISREVKSLLNTLEPSDYPRAPRVMDDQVVYIMDSMLKDVIQRGTATRARSLNRPDLAGKTGTTNATTDAWFAGYGGDIVTTTWMGFDNATTLGRREYGGTAALPIWIHFMGEALRNRPIIEKPQPPGLVTIRINPETGKRAQIGDAGAIFEVFRSEYVPPLEDDRRSVPSPWEQSEGVDAQRIF